MMDVSQCPEDGYAITPHDTNPQPGYGFQVGVAGDVTVITVKGTTVTMPACIAGFPYAMKFGVVKATGTTAASIMAYRG